LYEEVDLQRFSIVPGGTLCYKNPSSRIKGRSREDPLGSSVMWFLLLRFGCCPIWFWRDCSRRAVEFSWGHENGCESPSGCIPFEIHLWWKHRDWAVPGPALWKCERLHAEL